MASGFPGDGEDFGERRRRFRDRYGAADDSGGASDAEDHADDHSRYNLDINEHAAGLDMDNPFGRDQYDPSYSGSLNQAPQEIIMPDSRDGRAIERAQQLRDRLENRKREVDRYGSSRAGSQDGIDSLFDGKPSSRVPCSTSVVLAILFVGLIMVCVMAILALGSLQRLLGL